MGDEDLDIPTSWREVALHMRSITYSQIEIKDRITALENTIQGRRTFFNNAMFTNFLLPCISGAFLFLLTRLF